MAGLSMDERFSISNMTTEWGALVGWVPVDVITLDYLRGRRETLAEDGAFDRFSEAELDEWQLDPPRPGSTARYAGVIELAGEGVGDDPHGYRSQFIELVKKAQGLGTAIHMLFLGGGLQLGARLSLIDGGRGQTTRCRDHRQYQEYCQAGCTGQG